MIGNIGFHGGSTYVDTNVDTSTSLQLEIFIK